MILALNFREKIPKGFEVLNNPNYKYGHGFVLANYAINYLNGL